MTANTPPRQNTAQPAGGPAAAQGADTTTRLHLARPVAPARTMRPRHRMLAFSFVLLVLLPVAAAGWYLYARAADQYASTVGFAVRSEEMSLASDLLGGLAGISGSSSSDTDILYEYIQGQELVSLIDAKLDLRRIWSLPDGDPVFGYDPSGSAEDLADYWGRMVKIHYDKNTGLIELRVHAFDPQSAQTIAGMILDESTRMINELSAIARDDATRYARDELERAEARLKAAREAMTVFRSRTQIVDPAADIQAQMGLLTTLQEQLAAALIELDLLRETTVRNDPRIAQYERRIEVIRSHIVEERRKFGFGGQGPAGEDYATLIAEFESLTVDREFAEQSYTVALAAFDTAQAEARRQSRYLAAYIRPTLAETAQYPKRLTLLGLTALFLAMGWSIAALIYYSIRDRR